jgi:mannose-6-phosphate isomerase-like protein (cupin superfamily)
MEESVMPENIAKVAVAEALKRVPAGAKQRSASLFRHGTLELKIYAPRGKDDQTPHSRDEAYLVIAGSGIFVSEGQRQRFGVGDFLFAAAGVEHRFEDFTDDFAVWVIFYGPEGGEHLVGSE